MTYYMSVGLLLYWLSQEVTPEHGRKIYAAHPRADVALALALVVMAMFWPLVVLIAVIVNLRRTR